MSYPWTRRELANDQKQQVSLSLVVSGVNRRTKFEAVTESNGTRTMVRCGERRYPRVGIVARWDEVSWE